MAIKIDRQFMFLHQNNLSVFAERVLRNTQQNPYIPKPEEAWDSLQINNEQLKEALEDPTLKRKQRTEALRQKESQVLIALNEIADYIENLEPCKSDIHTTGFRPHTEHRRSNKSDNGTRRHQRLSAKMAKLEKA